MKPEQFSIELKKASEQLERFATTRFPAVAAEITERFINGNFRAQGWQGEGFSKWPKSKGGRGTTLVDTGTMRAATYIVSGPGQITIRNSTPYAKAHNEGFRGTVSVSAHTRNKYTRFKVGTGRLTKTGRERKVSMMAKTGSTSVKAHTRKVNIPQRQFIPTASSGSPVLSRAIERQVVNELKHIITL